MPSLARSTINGYNEGLKIKHKLEEQRMINLKKAQVSAC